MKNKTSITYKARHIFYALLCAVFFLSSCQKMKYGNIVEKWHEPERTYMYMMPIVHSTGKTIYTTFIPMIMHDNEDWCVKVMGIGTKGDTITRTYYVDRIAYDTLTIGKFICVDGACDEDNNNTKVRK